MKRFAINHNRLIAFFAFLLLSLMPARAQTQLISDGGFETLGPPWYTQNSTAGWWSINNAAGAHSGNRYEYIGVGQDGVTTANNVEDVLYQDISIPAGTTSSTLTFWLKITTDDTSGIAHDTLAIEVRSTGNTVLVTLANYSNANAYGAWVQQTLTINGYAGQTIRIAFHGKTDASIQTVFRVDDVSVLATIAATYTVGVSASPSAGGTVGGGGTFSSGGSCTVTATANNGYTFANWTENGSVVSSSAGYTFTVGGNRTLVANFTQNQVNYTVSLSASPSAGGTVSGGGSFASGSSQTVTATANSGYTFANWTEGGLQVSGSSSYTFTLNANRNLVANFSVNGGSPLSGKGDWIVNIAKTIANIPGATTFQDLINYEQSVGVKYLIVKAGEGNDPFPYSGMQLNSAFVSACHTAGLKVFGFHYVYGGAYQGRVLPNGQPDTAFDNVNSSVSSEIAIAIQILDTGCDGLVIDGESAYEDLAPGATITPGDGDPTRFYYPGTLPPNPSLSPVAAQSAAASAQAYCSGILTARPSAFLAHAPFFNPSGHQNFPYATFGKYCAAVIPQAYYRFNGLTPESTVAEMDSEWKTIQNSWIGSGHSDSVKPIFPAGYSVSPASGADITDFVNLLNTDASPATSGGYQGVSFYDADLQASGAWSAIASATIGSNPNPDTTPPAISAFSVTPSSIVAGSSFTASFTVSDSGGSALKQVVLRRTSGDGSAYDPGWQDIQTVTISGNGPVSGSFNPDTPPSAGTYWYGMAAFDNANNSMDERAAGLGPLQRVVTTATIPAITSPTPGSALTSSSATFQWSSGTGVSDYFLYVGSTLGENDIYGQDQGLNLTVSINGLPQNGSTLYVRLWWQISGAWYTADYSYTAYSQINYTVGVSASPSGAGTVSGGGTFSSGGSQTVTATANIGFAFANWTENGSVVSSSASYNFVLNANRNLVANFSVINVPTFGGSSVGGGALQTTLVGLSSGQTVILQSSSDLKNWTPMKTNVIDGSILMFTNTIDPAVKVQYFRAVIQ
jgi:hypothetical protein